MPECASCSGQLGRQTTDHGIIYSCPLCGGRAIALSVLRKAGAGKGFLTNLWLKARDKSAPRVRHCPHCTGRMPQVSVQVASQSMELDVCRRCLSVWFDASEYEQVTEAFPAPKKEKELPLAARRELAMAKVDQIRRQHEAETGGGFETEHAWQWLPAVLGMPVELDAPKVSRLPWATYGLVLTCVAVSVALFLRHGIGERLGWTFEQWGFIPGQWTRRGGLTLLTSMFLHGGILHLVGNMYFLYVFGDNTEDRLGWQGFLVLILAAHLGGMLLHGLLSPHPLRPCVGASAAISGVIAFYGVTYPRVRLGFMFWLFFMPRWIRMPAVVAFVLYFGLQIWGASQQMAGFGNVSHLGHVGGVAVGLVAALIAHFHLKNSRQAILDQFSPGK